MQELELALCKLLDIIESHHLMRKADIDEIASIASSEQYLQALWELTDYLETRLQHQKDLIPLLEKSWTLTSLYCFHRLEDFKREYKLYKECLPKEYLQENNSKGYLKVGLETIQRMEGNLRSCKEGTRRILMLRERVEEGTLSSHQVGHFTDMHGIQKVKTT